jgi:hypothetical protein
MTITRVGSTSKYADGWETAFGKSKRKTKTAHSDKPAATKKDSSKKAPAKKVVANKAVAKKVVAKKATKGASKKAKK